MGDDNASEKERLHAIMMAGLVGERERGNGGVVFVNKEKNIIKYILLHEVESEELRARFEDELTENGNDHLFIMEEVDRVMHIWKVPRDKLANLPFEIGA